MTVRFQADADLNQIILLASESAEWVIRICFLPL